MIRNPFLRLALQALFLAGLFWAIVFITQWRYGFDPADEGLLWYVSQRVLQGDLPILDWFSYDPARYYWSAAFFRLLGNDGLYELRLAATMFAMFGFMAAIASLIHARMPWPALVVSAFLISVMMCFPRHKNYEHSIVLILVACLYLAICGNAKYRWLMLGVATGLAACFGRNSGVYYVGASLLAFMYVCFQAPTATLKKQGKTMATQWVGGVFLGYSPMIVLLALNPAFREAFEQSVRSVGAWQASLPIPWPWNVTWLGATSDYQKQLQLLSIFCVLLPCLYVAGLLIAWFSRQNNPRLSALSAASSIAGLSYLHHGFDRADFAHLSQAGIASILVAASIFAIGLSTESRKIRACAGIFGVLLSLLLASLWIPFTPRSQHRSNTTDYALLDMNGDRFFVSRSFADLMETTELAISKCRMRDGQLLTAPYYPGVYAALGLRAPFWELYYAYQRPVEMQKAHIAALKVEHTGIAIFNRQANIESSTDRRLTATYPLLIAHIESNYTQVAGSKGSFETWIHPKYCRSAIVKPSTHRSFPSPHPG